ncbi:MAG TPA: M28 family peptidase [Gemmatimonadales bacterium]|nr:M28 family peptidase [Gemmatimonadales bacterium]
MALVFAAAPAVAQPSHARPTRPPLIDSLALRAHTYFLAHDLLEGRGTGRRGNDVAALYLAAQALALGLQGAGPDGSYFQVVPLTEAQIDTSSTGLSLAVDSLAPASREFSTPRDFIPNVGTMATLVPFSGQLAYVGSARDVLARPTDLPDLGGRVALVRGPFGSDMAAADTLRARGATGVIQLTSDTGTYALYVRSRGPSRIFIADSVHAVSSFIPPIPDVIASPALSLALVPAVAAGSPADRPALVPGRTVAVRLGLHSHPLVSRNVAAILSGSDPALRGEFVAYTAHLDHLGISTPDQRGDSIYNGFSDNAAGCAMLLAIAKAMAAGPRPARSVLFLWPTGEERGLLGSDFFAARPLVPLDHVVAEINLDAGAPPAPANHWQVAGGDRSPLGLLAVAVARRAGWDAKLAPASPNSDHFPLLRLGVPAVFLVPAAPYEGLSAEASQALGKRWDHYHQPGDEWASDFPFSGLVRYAEFGYRLGMAAAAQTAPGAGAR